jgi:predicted nucleic acid-binding protein
MNQYLLDTNICIHYLKGDFDLKRRFGKLAVSIATSPRSLLQNFYLVLKIAHLPDIRKSEKGTQF